MWKKVSYLTKQHRNEDTNLAWNHRPSNLPTIPSKVQRAYNYTTAHSQWFGTQPFQIILKLHTSERMETYEWITNRSRVNFRWVRELIWALNKSVVKSSFIAKSLGTNSIFCYLYSYVWGNHCSRTSFPCLNPFA